MRGILALILASLITVLPTVGETAEKEDGRLEAEIRQWEERRLQAMEKTDAGILNRILADDLVYVHSSGRVQTKAELIGSLVSGELEYVSAQLEEIKVRGYGSTAVATGIAAMQVRSASQEAKLRVRFTDVYVRIEGRWQMVSWQSTRLPETPKE